jgi:hypothetical protein
MQAIVWLDEDTMKRLLVASALFAAGAMWPGLAGASGDYGCSPRWTLAVSSYECAGIAMIGPRNDTRVNLAFLLRDQARAGASTKLSYPKWDWNNADYGHVFIDWDVLQSAFWPEPDTPATGESEEASYAGSRCQTLASGGSAFRSALATARTLTDADRQELTAARELLKPACDGDKTVPAWPNLARKPAQAWSSYLQGAWAFYAEDFAAAGTRFADLVGAKDPWLAETARYMVARNELATAQAHAFDEWGGYAGGDKVDRAAAGRARTALQDYLSTYPKGRYAASASGLMRRVAWLLAEKAPLAATYSALLREPARSPAMLEEVESKVFFGVGLANDAQAPLLLATWDLLRMRQQDPGADASSEAPPALTQRELAQQAQVFARQPELYGFLQASQAYHVERDPRRVLTLVPDDARARHLTPLAFSRQMLRGLALEALGDPAALGFWQQLAGGADDVYQNPAVQLALAMHWERSGELAKVFARSSLVTERDLRTILLARVAGADLLRRQAAGAPDARERSVALFTLLAKDLSRGHYADFGRDVGGVPAEASPAGDGGEGWTSSWMAPSPEGTPPIGLFTRGKFQEDYACPALARTAATLASRPTDVKARLCLAEFWRLNGFDDDLAGSRPKTEELGGTAEAFVGKPMPRAALYAAVLADRAAMPEDTAYALYRAIQCYAPSGNNACGGEDLPEAQRKTWFQRLKRDYPKSRWAIDLKYFW